MGFRIRILLAGCSLVLSGEAAATTQILSQSTGCYSNGVASDCQSAPVDFGPGASTSISRVIPVPGGNLGGSAAMAVADFDEFGARARASIDYSPGSAAPSVVHGVNGRAFASIVDTLTVAGSGSGTVRMQWSLTGANDIGFVGSNNILRVIASNQIRLDCFSNVGATFLNCNDALFIWDTAGVVSELVTIDVPILFGTPTTWTMEVLLVAGISVVFDDCLTCVALFSGRADADFGSTGTLVDVQLFDAVGNELDPSLIQAESGFRYDLVGQDVPEPLALAWMALAALGLRALATRPRVS
jgi:hypothetical protein